MDRIEQIKACWQPGITLTMLAERLDVSKSTVSRLYAASDELRQYYPAGPVVASPELSGLLLELFHLIRRRGLTMRIAADRSGIHYTTLSRWKRGKSVPRVTDVERVLKVLNK